jgi:hypothetical protein
LAIARRAAIVGRPPVAASFPLSSPLPAGAGAARGRRAEEGGVGDIRGGGGGGSFTGRTRQPASPRLVPRGQGSPGDSDSDSDSGGEGVGGGNRGPRYRGLWPLRRYTGDSTPFQFPVRPVRLVQEWPSPPVEGGEGGGADPDLSPFSSSDLSRIDPMPDRAFYSLPRLVYHIDEPAAAALTHFYRRTIPPGSEILDICSSWVSHYPAEFPRAMRSICGTGMNELELRMNDQLTGGYKVADLNESPDRPALLPYPDGSFDAVTCALSIDYLVRPVQVLREVGRVLRPGGVVIVSQSNRCFPTKAVRMWLDRNDRQRLELVNGYFAAAGGYGEPRQAYDITADVPAGHGYRDPMYAVVAVKK